MTYINNSRLTSALESRPMTTNNYQTAVQSSAEQPRTKFIRKAEPAKSIGGFDAQSFASRGFNRSNAKSSTGKSKNGTGQKKRIGWDDYFQSKMGAP
jgi:hypothetical protein